MDRLINEKEELKKLRKDIFITGYKGGMAHLASCYSCLEILYTLYLRGILKIDAQNAKWADRDRFILSKGHAGLALYGVMTRAGLMKEEEYHSYLKPGSAGGGHDRFSGARSIHGGGDGHGIESRSKPGKSLCGSRRRGV